MYRFTIVSLKYTNSTRDNNKRKELYTHTNNCGLCHLLDVGGSAFRNFGSYVMSVYSYSSYHGMDNIYF
jgi:hypothetical protein